MKLASCIDESGHPDALTYGRKYVILAVKEDDIRHTIKIKGDNGRTCWFPATCFDLQGGAVPLLQEFTIRDSLENAATSAIEVELHLSNGQRRWCFFATPDALKQYGDQLDGTTFRIHYGAPHLIVVEQLDAQIIEQALHYIERQGELAAYTCAYEISSDGLDNDSEQPSL